MATALKDDKSGTDVRVSPVYGDLSTVVRVPLLSEQFETTTAETLRVANTLVATGTGAIVGTEFQLRSGTNTGGSIVWTTPHKFAPIAGGALLMRALVSIENAPDADNVREIGLRGVTTEGMKACIQIGDTTASFIVDDNTGSPPATLTQTLMGHISPASQNYFTLEILFAREVIEVWINRLYVMQFLQKNFTEPMLSTSLVRPYALSTNSGSTTDNGLNLLEVSMSHLGDPSAGSLRVFEHSNAGDGQVIRGAGYLDSVSKIVDGSQVYAVHDGIDDTGSKIFGDTYFISSELKLGQYFAEGLYMDHTSGSADTLALFVRGIG